MDPISTSDTSHLAPIRNVKSVKQQFSGAPGPLVLSWAAVLRFTPTLEARHAGNTAP
jgi:hypothetical protein